jgi:hypothetical protein
MEVVNPTPFLMDRMVYLDRNAAERLVVVLKGTWSVSARGEISVAKKQAPIHPGEEFRGEPGESSILHEAELGPAKPATDVFLHGSAIAPRPGTRSMDVSFRVGPVGRTARVFGERRWTSGMGGIEGIDGPMPFESVPLTFENAFGGKDVSAEDPKHHGEETRNPVGRGFRSEKSKAVFEGALLPSVEDPKRLISQPRQGLAPAGFGPVGRHWMPRRLYAGTYDGKWMEERAPLLPDDFDDRFHNAAPPELIVPGRLKGGEPVEIAGCTPEGRLLFQLPRIAPWAKVLVGRWGKTLPLELDTVTVDTDAMELRLVWKGEVPVHREVARIRSIVCVLEGEKP